MRLENKVAVVTGASSGMGYEIVRHFSMEGASVLAVARRKERLEALKDACSDFAGRVEIYPADLSEMEENAKMIDYAITLFGKVDILVNNAGILDNFAGIGSIDMDRFDKVMKLNVYAPAHAMKKAVSHWTENGIKGNILNIASVGAMRSVSGCAYVTSKAAIVSLSKNTAKMYQKNGIRCNCIAPGAIATDISSSVGNPDVDGYMALKPFLDTSPEMGTGEDIAMAAIYLCSDESKYVSGDVIVVDGGWIA